MGWSDFIDGALDKLGGSGEAAAHAMSLPVGAVLDVARVGPWDLDEGPLDWFTTKKALGGVGDTLIGQGTVTGWAVNKTGEGLDWTYRNAIENPVESVIYHEMSSSDPLSWSEAWDLAKERNIGQTAQLSSNALLNGLSSRTGNWDTSAVVRGIPLVGSYLEEAGIGADLTKDVDPLAPITNETVTDKSGKSQKVAVDQAWIDYQKNSPFFSGALATTIDIAAQFAADPAILASKAYVPLKAYNNVRAEGAGFDDLLGTVKYEQKRAIVDDFGDTTIVPAVDELGLAPTTQGELVHVPVSDKSGWLDDKSVSEIYYGLRLDKVPEQGQAIATVLAKTNKIENAADRLNARRSIIAATRGDIKSVNGLRVEGHDEIADTLSNAFMGRQSGSIAAMIRDTGRAEGAPKAFNSPDVLAEIDRQLGNDKGYLESLRWALEYNPLRTSSKGERAIDRLGGKGLGRDGIFAEDLGVKNGVNKLRDMARARATGSLKNDGSVVDNALADSTQFEREASGITGTPIDSDIVSVTRGNFSTPVTVARWGLKAAAYTNVTPYMRAGYKVSDALRGRVVHGALSVEQGNEPLVAEFVRDRMRRSGVDPETAKSHLDSVLQATNPTDRFQSVIRAETASIEALGAKYGINKSAIQELMVQKRQGEAELVSSLDGQVYSAHTKSVLDDSTGEVEKVRGDVITMADEGGAMHIANLDEVDGATGFPILSTQTPNKVMLPDIDFVRRVLERDSGPLGAIGKLRDNAASPNPLVDQARELGLRSSAPLRAKNQANETLRQFAENTNANWKRATLLLRFPSFALRNTLEEELRLWATGNIATTTDIATRQAFHRLREHRRTHGKASKFNPELDAQHTILSHEREQLIAVHEHPETIAELKRIKGSLRDLRDKHTRAINAGDNGLAEELGADIAYQESLPELAEEAARKAQLADVDSAIAGVQAKIDTPAGIEEGFREVAGLGRLPNAYEGSFGEVMRKMTATGSVVDNETSGVASRSMSLLRGPGEDPIISAPSLGSTKDAVSRHMAAWKHILNNQIARAPEARVALLAKSRGADTGETVDEVRKFLDSDESTALRAANRVRSSNTTAWAQDITDMVEHHVPSTGIASELLDGEVTGERLAREVPDSYLRPDVHGAGVSSTVGHQARKLESIASWGFEKIDKMSLQPLTRHPLYTAAFQESQERLAKHYLDDLILREGDDAVLDVDDINKITYRAQRIAERKVKQTFYDTSSRSYAAHKMRYIYPFFAAHQDSMRFWGKAIADDPAVLRKLQMTFEQPAALGLAVDYDGNPAKASDVLSGDTYILMQMPKAWGGPDPTDPEAKQGRLKLRLSSFNLILQNGSVINPGAGPMAAVPAGYIQRKWGAGDEDVSKAMTWFNPYGAPVGDTFGGSALSTVTPAVLKRGYDALVGNHSHEYNQMFNVYMNEAQVKFSQEHDGAAPSKTQAKAMESEVADKVKWMSLLRLGASFAAPVQPTPQTRLQGFVSEYRRLQDQGRERGEGPLWASDKFLDTYGDAFIALTKSSSEYRANLDPTTATWNALQANKGLLKKTDPRVWQVIIGAEGEGAFSTNAYRAMQSLKVSEGSDDTLIDSKTPDERVDDIAISAGWRQYNKVNDNLMAIATAKGFTSIDQSPELSVLRQQANAELTEKFPQWAASRGTSSNYESEVIDSLRVVAADKRLLNDPGRPEIKLIGEYLQVRDAVKAALKMRLANGGSGSATAKSNADIVGLFSSYVHGLNESNTVFSNYVMTGLVERDPLYMPELAEVNGG